MAVMDPKMVAMTKDKAEDLFTKGRVSEALAMYEKIKSYGDKDPRIYLRMGDISRKLDNNDLAIGYYKDAVKSFVRLGFAIKAIALCKVIINIDPAQQEIQAALAQLVAKGGTAGATAPAALSRPSMQPPAGTAQRPAAQQEKLTSASKRLSKTPLFSDFTEEEFMEVVNEVKTMEVPSGQYLFKEGDSGDSIFFVVDGEVEIVGTAKNGGEISLARLGDGGIFGEFGFFSNARRKTGVRAACNITVLELEKQKLNKIIQEHPGVGAVLLKFYKERVVDRLMALSSIFMPLSKEDRGAILDRIAITKSDAGAVIVREGEPGDKMYLIKEGTVRVWVSGKDGAKKDLCELHEGDFFGEIALATNKPRVASVTAATEVTLVEFSRAQIRDVIGKYPQVRDILTRIIKERVADATTARDREQREALV